MRTCSVAKPTKRHATPASPATLYAAPKSSFVLWDSFVGAFDNFSTSLAREVQRGIEHTERCVHSVLIGHTSPACVIIDDTLGLVMPDQHDCAVVVEITHILVITTRQYTPMLRLALTTFDELFDGHLTSRLLFAGGVVADLPG